MNTVPQQRLWLASLLFDMREAFDEQTALKFAAEFGGNRLSVPKRALAEHKVTRLFGQAVMEWLVKRDGGSEITVPLANQSFARQRLAAIEEDVQNGTSTAELVKRYGIHRETVKRARRRLRARASSDQTSFDF